MTTASEINKIIVRQLQRHKLEYEIDLDPNEDNQEVVFCYDENLGQQRIFKQCSEEELTLLFSALIENKALNWVIALEIAKLLPEKGYLIEDKFSIDDWAANPFYGFNQLLLAALGSDQKYESEIIKLLDAVPVDARDGVFMACEALNTPAICRKLMEKFTQWIKADPRYGNGTGEGQFLEKFIVLWQNTQDRELVNEFAAFCRKNWHYAKEEKMKIVNTIFISLGVGVAVLIGLGIGFISYLSYQGARVPVYQTEITDFEMQKPKVKVNAEEMQSEMQKLLDTLGVKTLKCFIFHTNPNRTVYRIIMVGNITTPKDIDFSEYLHEESLLKDDTLLSTLELCGISPLQNKVYTKLAGLLANASPIYINKNHIILDQVMLSEKVLKNDEQKKTFLQQIIRPRSENK